MGNAFWESLDVAFNYHLKLFMFVVYEYSPWFFNNCYRFAILLGSGLGTRDTFRIYFGPIVMESLARGPPRPRGLRTQKTEKRANQSYKGAIAHGEVMPGQRTPTYASENHPRASTKPKLSEVRR